MYVNRRPRVPYPGTTAPLLSARLCARLGDPRGAFLSGVQMFSLRGRRPTSSCFKRAEVCPSTFTLAFRGLASFFSGARRCVLLSRCRAETYDETQVRPVEHACVLAGPRGRGPLQEGFGRRFRDRRGGTFLAPPARTAPRGSKRQLGKAASLLSTAPGLCTADLTRAPTRASLTATTLISRVHKSTVTGHALRSRHAMMWCAHSVMMLPSKVQARRGRATDIL